MWYGDFRHVQLQSATLLLISHGFTAVRLGRRLSWKKRNGERHLNCICIWFGMSRFRTGMKSLLSSMFTSITSITSYTGLSQTESDWVRLSPKLFGKFSRFWPCCLMLLHLTLALDWVPSAWDHVQQTGHKNRDWLQRISTLALKESKRCKRCRHASHPSLQGENRLLQCHERMIRNTVRESW